MTDRVLVRSDDYVIRRQVLRFAVVDDAMQPMPLAGCKVQSTWRTAPGAPGTDPTNASAIIAASITFDAEGAVTASDKLALPSGGTADAGVLYLVLDRDQTAILPLGTTLKGDVQVTDANDERLTVFVQETITTIDGFTDDPVSP